MLDGEWYKIMDQNDFFEKMYSMEGEPADYYDDYDYGDNYGSPDYDDSGYEYSEEPDYILIPEYLSTQDVIDAAMKDDMSAVKDVLGISMNYDLAYEGIYKFAMISADESNGCIIEGDQKDYQITALKFTSDLEGYKCKFLGQTSKVESYNDYGEPQSLTISGTKYTVMSYWDLIA